ncbi:cysteine hydrolase family protein [Undibacterium cyanobacteriorum]|uniref:Cysteine hydrolase family protein n=1 Tax=Undibacterium cyanobacteriorum TaxID=3073561 RepID=A0ABY9RE91_9BURK|nr:cysteine hydrolase family protein [Undibacterium sp. 20NA77.5]WMW79276.1 cysteine hydrolase family protein [Undibacterium sp. 20NA77.5]
MTNINLHQTRTALLLIDVQMAFDDPYWGARNNPAAEGNIALLLKAWRQANLPVIHVRHCSVEEQSPLREDRPGNAYKPEATPLDGEIEFRKSVNSAFIGTQLHEYLQRHEIHQIVIVGISTDHCVSTTTRMGANLGYQVHLVADACFSFERVGWNGQIIDAEQVHQINLASLNREFCTLHSTSNVIENLKQVRG